MITPIDTNWFTADSSWTTVQSNFTTAQNAYNTAQSNLTAYTSTYTAAETALSTFLSNHTAPLSPTDQMTLQTRTNTFNTDQAQYNSLVGALQTAATNFIAAQQAEEDLIDSDGNSDLTTYVNDLTGGLPGIDIGQDLTLSGKEPNSLDTELTQANSTRSTTRSTFFSDLATFQQTEMTLAAARAALQQDQDSLLLDQANDMLNGLTSPSSTTTTAQTTVTNEQSTVSSLVTTRDPQQTTLDKDITAYTDAINAFTGVLQDAADASDSDASQFISGLATAQSLALMLYNNSLSQSAAADAAAQTLHYEEFSTNNQTLVTDLGQLQAQTLSATNLVFQSGLNTPVNIVSAIDMPKLPPAGTMSIMGFMRFISAIQLLVSELSTVLQQSDSNISVMRLKVWALQGTEVTQSGFDQYSTAIATIGADAEYDVQVAQSNILSSNQIVQAINNLSQNTGNINAIITTINQEIVNQNAQGQDATTALNNSNFIAVDTINQAAPTTANAVNTNNILNQDTPVTVPSPISDVPIVSNPATIPPLAAFSITGTIPSSFPLVLPDPTSPVAINNLPTNPSPSDIAQLNSIVDSINEQLLPIQSQISGPPINYQFIDPFFLRATIPVRDVPDFVDMNAVAFLVSLIGSIVDIMESTTQIQLFQATGNVLSPQNPLEPTIHAVTEDQFSMAQYTGEGYGILSNNILSPQPQLSEAITQVLSSTDINNSIKSLTENASIVGGLIATTTTTPTVPVTQNYSQLGLVRTDETEIIDIDAGNTLQTDQPPVQTAPSPAQTSDQTTSAATVQSLLSTANNTALLTQVSASLLAKLNTSSLSTQDIQKLLTTLTLLLQLLISLVAVLVAAASGGATNIDQTVAGVLQNPNSGRFGVVANDLKTLGINVPQNLTPTTPRFEENFLNALSPQLSPAAQALLTSQLTSLFQAQGITLGTNVPLGTAVQNALSSATLAQRAALRDQVIADSIAAAETLVIDTVNGQTTPTLADRLTNSSPSPNPSPSPVGNSFIALAPETQNSVNTQLNQQAPPVAGLSTENRNAIVLGVVTGSISTDRASDLLSLAQRVQISTTNPTIADLLGQATIHRRTAVVPHAAGITGATRSPQTAPADTPTQLRNAFQALSKQADDDRFVREVTLNVADKVRDQTDFFQRSVNLILDPARSIIRNFSITTKTTDRKGRDTPLDLPISG